MHGVVLGGIEVHKRIVSGEGRCEKGGLVDSFGEAVQTSGFKIHCAYLA